MAVEWVKKYHAGERYMIRQRLGVVAPTIDVSGLTAEELKGLSPFRRWVDLVVISANYVLLCEFKMREQFSAMGQLLLYDRLFGLTEELKAWWTWPRKLRLVIAIEDPAASVIARAQGIEVEQYNPSFLSEWASWQALRHRRPPKT